MVQATTLNAFSSERHKENVISRSSFKIIKPGASLVAPAQPVQETWVRSLTWEDPTCGRVTEPVAHHYWACAPPLLSLCPTTAEPVPHHYWACALEPGMCLNYWSLQALGPVRQRRHRNETLQHSNQRAAPAHHNERKAMKTQHSQKEINE